MQVTGYEIERSTDEGLSWSVTKSNTGSSSTVFSDTGLAKHTIYTYRVFAIDSSGTGPASNSASATTK